MSASQEEIPPPPPPPPSSSQTPQQTPHTVSTIKLPILKKGEYDIWAMKMEHYLAHTDYPIWEVIQNGNGPVSITTDTSGQIKVLPPRTAEEIVARERERKARTTLLMALPEDHLAKFHKMTDAKEMWDAIKSRFGGNDESKKMQKYILKQQFEGFSVSNTEGLHKIDEYDLEEIDLKWQVAMISMRMKKFYKKTGRKLQFDAKEAVGFDKTKVECYNCHKTGHFARECRIKGTQDNRRRDAWNSGNKDGSRTVQKEDSKALVTIDGEGVDWTNHSEDEDYALMACNSSDSDTEVISCSNKCKESYANLKKLYDAQREQLSDASIEIKAYSQDLDDKTDVLTYHKKLLAEAQKEKEDLKAKVEKWHNSSKNLSKLLNTQMSANDKFGLGYGDHRYDGILSYENEMLQSVFMNKESEIENQPLYDRFVTAEGMHAVPPPMTGNYMPSGPDVEVDDSNAEPSELVSEPVVNESNVECQPKVWSDAPIIEEYESDSEDECVSIPTKQQETPSFANQQVKTPRENVKSHFTHSQKPKVDKKDLGDCDFHEKRMARKAELNNGWNNVQRVNKQNQFVPSAVLTRTGIFPVNTARTSGTKIFSTVRQSVNRQTVLTSTAMKVNTVKPIVNRVRPANVFHKTHSPSSRPFKKTTVLRTDFSKQKINTAKVNAVSTVGGKRETAVKPSAGCNWRPQRYNWHNISKYNGGSNLRNCYTFKDPLGRLKPKQAWLPDENQVLLKIPRQNNMYSFNLENIVPSGGLACLIAKATTDESNKWHRRFSWVFFLRTKDETSGILKEFIRQIENQLNQKVKTIRSDNGTEFKNKDVIEFCGLKGIKREYSNARTPQQNGVAERKNRTLIEAARTMLADSFLPNTFWAEAVSTACYVLNKVLVTKPHNKTPYELLTGKIPIISYIRPFGCHVTILNTIDHLGKFAGKSDEGFLVSSENQANLHAGQQEANQNAALTTDDKREGPREEEQVFMDDLERLKRQEKEANEEAEVLRKKFEHLVIKEGAARTSRTKSSFLDPTNPEEDDSEIPPLEDIYQKFPTDGIFTTSSYDNEGAVADFTNLETVVNEIQLKQVQQEASNTSSGAHAFVSNVQKQKRTNIRTFIHCLFACFLSQHEPKKISEALEDESWVDAMQENVAVRDTESMGLIRFAMEEGYQRFIGSPHRFSRSKISQKVYNKFVKAPLWADNKLPEPGLNKRNLGVMILRALMKIRFQMSSWESSHFFLGLQVKNRRKMNLISQDKYVLVLDSFPKQCKKQTIVATSTTEAEYVAAASCYGQVLWIQNQMLDYGFNFMNTKIYIDNESTICIVKNPVYHSKTKHIAIRHHFIRDAYEKKLIQVLKIHTDDNVADLLTKAFDVSRGLIGFRESLRRVIDGTEALLLPTLFILWLDTVSTDSAKLVPLGKVCTAIETLKKNTAKALISLLTTITLSTTMAVLDSCPKHNMVAYLEKSEGNAEFHEIIDFLTRSSIHHALTVSPVVSTTFVEQFWTSAKSKIINNVRHITAKVAGKPVSISEASIRSDLLFDDANGIDSLPNQAIFDAIQLMGYEGDLTVLTFNKALFSPQWRFLFHTMNHCISSKSTSWDQIPTNIATAVICLTSNQKYNFSKLIFDGMLRHLDAKKKFVMYPRFISIFLDKQLANVPVPLDHFPVNALTSKVFSFMVKKGKHFLGKVTPLFASMLVQPTKDEGAPLERPSEAQPTPSSAHTREVSHVPQTDSSPAHTTSTIIPDSILESSGGNLGGHSSSDKSLSGNEGEMTLQSGKKFAKGEPSVQRDPLFDEIPEDTLDHMETENAQDVERTRDIVGEEKENDEDLLSTKDVLSTDKEKVSTDGSKVSTDRQKDSTDEQRKGTDDHTKEGSVTQTTQPSPTSTIFGDDETIAKVLLNMSQAKAVSKENEKGVELKDIEETDRPRPTSTRSLMTLKPLPKIDPKDKGKKKIEKEDEYESEYDGIPEAEKKFKQLASDEEMARKARIEADRLLAEKLQEEEREQFTIEERAKFLHDIIAAQRKFLAQQIYNGQKRYFSTLMRVLSVFDRDDLNAIYQLVMDKYQDEIPEGFDRVLWGDLMIMFSSDDEDKFWNSQQD
ncbi:ribonuclease H-like domain-containing protein [Tanacetum coccineum]|uniref:Ribonuclease H-like domain-containing protein n=1 Tax=Tanacetum coccineum TaxID=301880 RepID=A0ABQ4YKW5_9ASTR